MVNHAIIREKQKKNGLSKTQLFRIFSVSSTGYYSWCARQEDRDGKQAVKKEKLMKLQEYFRQIIQKLCFVPGKRTFRMHMWRDHGINISIKHAKKIMKTMGLLATLPKKDAYKGQATHGHVCAAKQNHVMQGFKLGPRKIVLTDITYLYYGANRTLCYLCAFKDAYTSEILGHAVSERMDVQLVKDAYEQMMKNYGAELKQTKVYVHSDQGSQYLSTEFQQLLSDEGFIQSMSARGNSQDNAPMESFFGRMKTEIIDIIARCTNKDVVAELIKGYMSSYNTKRYQYELAGLTPCEYYQYVTTDIYPLDNYFGIQSSEIMSINQLVEAQMERKKVKAEQVKAKRQAKEKELALSPITILTKDQKKLKSEIRKWEKQETLVTTQLKKLRELFEKTKEAVRFYETSSKEIREDLKDPQKWKEYKAFDYVNELSALY